jgi:hypothetical protein
MIEKVTDAFAFILENGEFTETILFADDEIEELKPDERAAIKAVLVHVEACYVDLLSECRRAFLECAKGSPLAAIQKTLSKNESQPQTIWKRAMVHVPLVIRSSWVAWVSFGLWPNSDPKQSIRLGAHITTQRKFLPDLQDAVKASGAEFRAVPSGHAVDMILPKEGQAFHQLALDIASRTLPIAVELWKRIEKPPAPVP